ncbi:MAG: hypothetical protein DRM99_04860 [Thermoplasmata archaeon]|nr:MAG: hypothetical protein DRM99_04860 [Thermoplasmata archaeon]
MYKLEYFASHAVENEMLYFVTNVDFSEILFSFIDEISRKFKLMFGTSLTITFFAAILLKIVKTWLVITEKQHGSVKM